MENFENKIINIEKPNIYVRHVNNTFMQIENEEEFIKLKTTF